MNKPDPPKPSPQTQKQVPHDREQMSRALGAAFLQHQVQQLERNLDDMSFRRDRVPNAQTPSRTRASPSARNGKPKLDSRHVASSSSGQSSNPHQPTMAPLPLEVRVIDTSILIFALPVLKRWKAEGKFKIVIPLDGQSQSLTLDKKCAEAQLTL